jgi:hypothetical protein
MFNGWWGDKDWSRRSSRLLTSGSAPKGEEKEEGSKTVEGKGLVELCAGCGRPLLSGVSMMLVEHGKHVHYYCLGEWKAKEAKKALMSFKKVSILMVDDLNRAQTLQSRLGISQKAHPDLLFSTTYKDNKEAVTTVGSERFDFILLDAIVPKELKDVCEAIKGSSYHPKQVIFYGYYNHMEKREVQRMIDLLEGEADITARHLELRFLCFSTWKEKRNLVQDAIKEAVSVELSS